MKSVNSFNQVQPSHAPYRFSQPGPTIDGKRVLVTGASGFIGKHLLSRLLSRECSVRALVRSTPPPIEKTNPQIDWVRCHLGADDCSLDRSIEGCDYVFHLAAATRSKRSAELIAKNTSAFRSVLNACCKVKRPPKLVFVSSLAASGPCDGDQLLSEKDPKRPISFYGKSKAACEDLALDYAERLPISIVRPPIVLGPGDRNGFKLFHSIQRWKCHLVPGFRDHLFSVIHVTDLVSALLRVAELGRRISPQDPSQGVYFATGDSVVSYAGLGRQIGYAVGHDQIRFLRIPKWMMRSVGAANEWIGQLLGKPRFLNSDKCREGTAGSWACSGNKLRLETGFRVDATFESRLAETADWYRKHGWL